MSSPTVLAYLFPATSAAAGEDDWRADATCQYIDPEIFFPDVGHRGRSGNRCAPDAPPPHGAVSGRSPTTKRTASGGVSAS